MSIGVPVRSALSYFDKQNKYLDSVCQSGVGFQHILYILKFVLKEQYENKNEAKHVTDPKIKRLISDRNKLFHLGMSAFLINILSIPLKLFNIENKYLKIIHDIYDELADRGVSLYFSWRRTLIGKKHKLANPELYSGDTAKIISDKLPEVKCESKEEEGEEKKPVVRALRSMVMA